MRGWWSIEGGHCEGNEENGGGGDVESWWMSGIEGWREGIEVPCAFDTVVVVGGGAGRQRYKMRTSDESMYVLE